MKKIVFCVALFTAMLIFTQSEMVAMPKPIASQKPIMSSDWICRGSVNLYYGDGTWHCSCPLYYTVVDGYVYYKILYRDIWGKERYDDVVPNPQYNPNGSNFISQCKYTTYAFYIKDI